jgi:hypothetical protein
MTTAIASGLGATWGLAQEVTVGTFVAPTRWMPFIDDKMIGEKKTAQSEALHGGLYELAQRRRLVFHGAKGPVELDLTDRQLGLLIEHMIGSSPSVNQQGGAAAYLQYHVPGDLIGKSLSLQAGRPTIGGQIQAFSYNGCKITEWELSCAVGEIGKLTTTFDGWDESTSTGYSAASYVADNVLAFVDGQLLLGGVVTTVNGFCSVSAGAAPAGVVSSISLKGSNGLDVERQSIGSLVKREQLANAFRKYTGQAEVEFANLTDFYNAYYADTPLTLQLNFAGAQIGTTAYNAELNITCPSIRFNGAPPEVDGPGIIKVSLPFDILDDGTDPVIQFLYQSADAQP